MAERDPSLYALQTMTAVMVLSRLQITEDRVQQIAFDGYKSLASFVGNEDRPLDKLHVSFSPTAEQMEPYAAIIEQIKAKALDILGLGGRNYTLTNFYISTTDKVLEISAVSAAGDDRKTESMSGAVYDTILAANRQLAVDALTVGLNFGKTHDAFLWAMTAV